jgi:hypothetical protein
MLFNKDVDDLIAHIADLCEQLNSCRKNGSDVTAIVSELEDAMNKYAIIRKNHVNFGHTTITLDI